MEKIVIKLEKTSKISFWIAEGGLFFFIILISVEMYKAWNMINDCNLIILGIS